jgi:hypothetical protein
MLLRFWIFSWTVALGMAGECYGTQTPSGGNAALARTVDSAMRGRSGSAVVVDVASGRILAAYRLDAGARRLVRPGSTVKTFALLAMLQSGVVKSDTELVCRRRVHLKNRRMDCSHVAVARALDPPSALAYSCNYWFAHFATQLSDSAFTQTLVSSGFTSQTGAAPGEAVGSVESSKSPEELQLKAVDLGRHFAGSSEELIFHQVGEPPAEGYAVGLVVEAEKSGVPSAALSEGSRTPSTLAVTAVSPAARPIIKDSAGQRSGTQNGGGSGAVLGDGLDLRAAGVGNLDLRVAQSAAITGAQFNVAGRCPVGRKARAHIHVLRNAVIL